MRYTMSINKFYLGYLTTFLIVMLICVCKYTFLEIMAMIGISTVGTAIIFAVGWIFYRTYLYIYDKEHSGVS